MPANKKLFVKDGLPARFFISPSIKRESQRQNLKQDIEAHGGRVASTDDHVDTVLISQTDDKQIIRHRYRMDNDKHKRAIHVERLTFVQHCISHNQFEHIPPIIKGMGGKGGHKQGRVVPFTDEDDQNLCMYIARTQPHKEAGGRQGFDMYKRLVHMGVKYPNLFGWARRHTFHSWRERYKRYKDIFDPEIERIAIAEELYDDPFWPEDRRMSKNKLKTKKHQYSDDDEDGPEEEEQEEDNAEEEDEGEPLELEGDQLLESGQEEDEDQLLEEGDEGLALEDDQEVEKEISRQSNEADWGRNESEPLSDKDGDVETNKRKRGQPATVSGHVSKKRRTSTRRKGEDRELSVEIDAPGPSHVPRSPDRTLVDRTSRSNIQQSFTQETLVNTQTFEPVSHSTSANRRHSGTTSRSQPVSHFVEQEQEAEPVFGSPQSTSQPIIAESPGADQQPPSQTEAPVQKPRPNQRTPLNIVQVNDAPYRNTRARSRSIEPLAVIKPRTKRKAAVKQASRVPVSETIEEEIHVENILTTEISEAGPSAKAKARDPSLETDDAQTREDLDLKSTMRGGASKRPLVSNRINPNDILLKFKSSGPSRRYTMLPLHQPPSQNNLALDENRLPRWSEPILPGLLTFKPLSEPRTPLRTRESMSSDDTAFPLEGTRASAVKKKRREQERHSSYVPPRGTRAAELAKSR